MSNTTFEARVKLPNGSQEVVTIPASNLSNARAMLEAQYGKGNVLSVR